MAIETNHRIARKMHEMANVLELQHANPFRIKAYRRAAQTLSDLSQDVGDIYRAEGVDGLIQISTIGSGIANSIEEILLTGRWMQLERLRGTLNPVLLFQVVPGIGPRLATRLHEQLHLDTLEDLETAIHDGRVAQLNGVGRRRCAAIAAALEAMLVRQRRYLRAPSRNIPIDLILRIDNDYRSKAASDELPTIAPKRFNPQGQSWLPVMHEDYDGWHATALYSNTALAHKLKRNKDWVVIYYYDGDHREGQHTVVTETRGALQGKRVVRGRERECREYYAARDNARRKDHSPDSKANSNDLRHH